MAGRKTCGGGNVYIYDPRTAYTVGRKMENRITHLATWPRFAAVLRAKREKKRYATCAVMPTVTTCLIIHFGRIKIRRGALATPKWSRREFALYCVSLFAVSRCEITVIGWYTAYDGERSKEHAIN